jgi:glutamine amidotransferase-like uncharacterized protein/Spy/CpxP family protein refolding chaperone
MSRWHVSLFARSLVCILSVVAGDALARQSDEKPSMSDDALRLYVMQACAMPNVQKELKLTDDQLDAMAGVRDRIRDAGAISGEGEKVHQAFVEALKTIKATLSAEQQKRLGQLHLQGLGIAALQLPRVVAVLQITGQQLRKLEEITSKLSKALRELDKDIDMPLSELRAKRKPLSAEARSASFAVLTPSQREKFEELKGPSFDFSVRVPPAKGYAGRNRNNTGMPQKHSSASDKPPILSERRPQPHISAFPSSKPIKTALTAEMAQLVESMAVSSARTDADQLRVAVFSTKNGDPTDTFQELLESKLRCKPSIVTAEEIRAGVLKKFDVVLFPGGSGSRQADKLQNEGRQTVRQFVEEGGGYVGICAGAFLASCRDKSSLNLINVMPLTGRREVSGPHGMTSIDMVDRGGRILKIELTAAGSRILGERSGLLDTGFSGGPVFIPARRNDLPACVGLAFYRTEVWLHKVQRGTMVDTPAILAAPFGKGRVIIFSPHPEFSDPKLTPGLDSFVTRAVLATARKSK